MTDEALYAMHLNPDADPRPTTSLGQQLVDARIFLAVILAGKVGPLSELQRDMLNTTAEILDRVIKSFTDEAHSADAGPPSPHG